MSSYIILCEVTLAASNHPTGYTRHYVGGSRMGKPHILQIVQFLNDPGYYLYYLAEDRRVLTDTYHDSCDRAMAQAGREFTVTRNQWQFVNQQHIDGSKPNSEGDAMLERIRKKLREHAQNSHRAPESET